MNEQIKRIAAVSNQIHYNSSQELNDIDGSPHLKHLSLINLYSELILDIYDYSLQFNKIPKVLDLGSGEGSVTLPFLELGAAVTSVDISAKQLSSLENKCGAYRERLEIHCIDIHDFLKDTNEKFDVVVLNSFLHHIPDYMSLIDLCIKTIEPEGQFFSFQDPLRYDSLSLLERKFDRLSYLSWRIFRKDLVKGFFRYLRRSRGIYIDNCPEDNAEYHVLRDGVDQDLICNFLSLQGFDFRLIKYFSTQAQLAQFIGEHILFKNTFSIISRRKKNPK